MLRIGANRSVIKDAPPQKKSVGLMIENILSISMLVFLDFNRTVYHGSHMVAKL